MLICKNEMFSKIVLWISVVQFFIIRIDDRAFLFTGRIRAGFSCRILSALFTQLHILAAINTAKNEKRAAA